ncbi:MAG: TlpA disulfide reductase family protein [Isosphaeraceae bacterium]
MVRVRRASSWKTWTVLLAGVAVQATSAASAAADDPPRYRLTPGMVLSYEGRSTLRYGSDTFLEELDTTAWVVRHNPDGSCRVVIRVGSRLRGAGTPNGRHQPPPMGYHLGYFDLFSDGRLGADADVNVDTDPAICFPRLPANPSTGEWGQRDPHTGEEYGYSALRRGPDGWAFRAERRGPWKTVNGMSFVSTYRFDRGMVVGAAQEFSQQSGAVGRGTGTLRLAGVETKDAARVATFARAADRFFASTRAYRTACQAAAKDADNGPSLMANARTALQSARDATDDPDFRRELDRKLAGHDARVRACMELANHRAAVVGKASPAWSLQGLDGRTRTLADYRGKVVVLDFWNRGCGWCLKAMPEMNAVAARFKGRPVAVLGLNTDAKEEDARFVAEVMDLKYPTLRARGVPETYRIKGFPTVVLIGSRRGRPGRPRRLLADAGRRPDEGDRGDAQAGCEAEPEVVTTVMGAIRPTLPSDLRRRPLETPG